MGVKHSEHLPVEMVVAITIFVSVIIALVLNAVYMFGKVAGYKECLDDARLGKPPKYKLVETAKKWVRR